MPEFKMHEAFVEPGAEEYKKKGNAAFQAQDWDEAIKNYNKAITLDPKQASFYSNRAACWSSKGKHDSALSDAKKCLETDPTFVKGFSRKAKALFDLGRLDEAEAAYKEGLAVDASNAGLTSGLSDVQRARSAQASASSARSSFGGAGASAGMAGMAGKFSGMGKKLMETMKNGGMGGRMQMYAVVMVGYYVYNNFVKTPGSAGSTAPGPSGSRLDDDIASGLPSDAFARGFAQVEGSWLSYLHTGARADKSLLLLLHSSSLSAEAEYGDAITSVLAKATPPKGGLRILAPDRPCHGFSPCAASASAAVESFLAARAQAKHVTVVASGRVAARHALDFAKDRTQATNLVLINPRSAGPVRSKAKAAADLRKWLDEHAGDASALAFADKARWLTASGADKAGVEDDRLEVNSMAEGSKVVAVYTDGAKEDAELHEDLDGSGIPVTLKRPSGDLSEAIAEEAWHLLTAAEE